MLTVPLRFRAVALSAVFAVGAGLAPLGFAQSPAQNVAKSGAQCTLSNADAASQPEVAVFLERHGLALTAQCDSPDSQSHAKLLVLDSSKASEVLRGPLADGEWVETGAPAEQLRDFAQDAGDQFAPDVHFNRRWLASAVAPQPLAKAHNAADGHLRSSADMVRLAVR